MAAIDFPASPVLGQVFVANGISYRWNGYGWLVSPSDLSGPGAGFVAKTGDVMTGDLFMNVANPTIRMDKAASGEAAEIIGGMAGNIRWRLVLGGNVAESGANAGSNFLLEAYNDAGVLLSTPLLISRATGLLLLKGDPTAPLGAATKQYVDAIATATTPMATLAEAQAGTDNTKAVSPLTHVGSHKPAFFASKVPATSVGYRARTAVTDMTETLDTDNCFNGARFTPSVPGWYAVGGQLSVPTNGGFYSECSVRLNGTILVCTSAFQASGSQTVTLNCNGMVFMNGSSDYIELVGISDYAASPLIYSPSFWAHRLFA